MFIYSQSTGLLWDDRGHVIATGYSGYEGGKNAPKFEAISFKGPIPRGLWTIGEPYDSKNVGPFALPVSPTLHTAHGRTDFVIHGDSISNPGNASRGCVILPRHIRERVHQSNDKILRVIE